MADITNLNQYRKAKARAEKRARADANAVKHGRTKAERAADQHASDSSDRTHRGKKLDKEDVPRDPKSTL